MTNPNHPFYNESTGAILYFFVVYNKKMLKYFGKIVFIPYLCTKNMNINPKPKRI